MTLKEALEVYRLMAEEEFWDFSHILDMDSEEFTEKKMMRDREMSKDRTTVQKVWNDAQREDKKYLDLTEAVKREPPEVVLQPMKTDSGRNESRLFLQQFFQQQKAEWEYEKPFKKLYKQEHPLTGWLMGVSLNNVLKESTVNRFPKKYTDDVSFFYGDERTSGFYNTTADSLYRYDSNRALWQYGKAAEAKNTGAAEALIHDRIPTVKFENTGGGEEKPAAGTVTVNVTNSFGDIHENVDLERMVDYLTQGLSTAVYGSCEGVHR